MQKGEGGGIGHQDVTEGRGVKISSRLECLEEKINLFRSDIEYFTEIMVIDRNESVEQNKTIVYNELDITTNVNY